MKKSLFYIGLFFLGISNLVVASPNATLKELGGKWQEAHEASTLVKRHNLTIEIIEKATDIDEAIANEEAYINKAGVTEYDEFGDYALGLNEKSYSSLRQDLLFLILGHMLGDLDKNYDSAQDITEKTLVELIGDHESMDKENNEALLKVIQDIFAKMKAIRDAIHNEESYKSEYDEFGDAVSGGGKKYTAIENEILLPLLRSVYSLEEQEMQRKAAEKADRKTNDNNGTSKLGEAIVDSTGGFVAELNKEVFSGEHTTLENATPLVSNSWVDSMGKSVADGISDFASELGKEVMSGGHITVKNAFPLVSNSLVDSAGGWVADVVYDYLLNFNLRSFLNRGVLNLQEPTRKVVGYVANNVSEVDKIVVEPTIVENVSKYGCIKFTEFNKERSNSFTKTNKRQQ